MTGSSVLARLALVAVLAASSPAGADVSGPARVIDGDTIDIAGRRIRLFGIDAPEARQTCRRDDVDWLCGRQAAEALRARGDGEVVTCQGRGRDRYRRMVAVCYVAGLDLNRWMVAEGWALAYRRYAMDYVRDEDAARNARRGLWRGDFTPPWEWRQRR